jgi:hypothetical protein
MSAPEIVTATRDYERWMADRIAVVRGDLVFKHEQMDKDLFSFFRATFYRWAQVWPDACADLAGAPPVQAVGDLHVENFGTWRDGEGRLVWGINDFDEAHPLAYTIDLTRLATSAFIAIRDDHMALTPRLACEAILSGYKESLARGGGPLVLAESNRWLRRLAISALGDPARFWKRMDDLSLSHSKVPESADLALRKALVQPVPYRVARRRVGDGSLGRQRLVAMGQWRGARVAREAKSLLPSAWLWAHPERGDRRNGYMTTVNAAVRCPDPFLAVTDGWIVRRLAPDCARIELAMLPTKRDDERLLHAMGWETANIHLGSLIEDAAIVADMKARPTEWLRDASRRMLEAVERDWKRWRGWRGRVTRPV